MDKILASFIDTLQKQLLVYKKLYALSLEKQPVLVKGNIKELEKITKEEELLIIQVGRLEEQRKVLHRQLAGQFGVSPESFGASELVKRTDDKTGAFFQSLVNEMTGVITDLGEKNKVNNEMIQNSLDYINFSLNVLTSDSLKPGYNPTEEEKKSASAKIFDRTI